MSCSISPSLPIVIVDSRTTRCTSTDGYKSYPTAIFPRASTYTGCTAEFTVTPRFTTDAQSIHCTTTSSAPQRHGNHSYQYVRELHDIARSSYLVWRQSGKPRGDVTEGDMRTSRLRFKYALRQCQNNDEIMRADALARSLYCKDSVSFLERSQKCEL